MFCHNHTSLLTLVVWSLVMCVVSGVAHNETQRLQCIEARSELIDSHDDLSNRFEGLLDGMKMKPASKDKHSQYLGFPKDAMTRLRTSCTDAGGRFETFTGIQSCVYFDGMFKGTREETIIVNMAECFAIGPRCDNYTIESWLEAIGEVFEKACQFVEAENETSAWDLFEKLHRTNDTTTDDVKDHHDAPTTNEDKENHHADPSTELSSSYTSPNDTTDQTKNNHVVALASTVLVLVLLLLLFVMIVTFRRYRQRSTMARNNRTSYEITAAMDIDEDEDLSSQPSIV